MRDPPIQPDIHPKGEEVPIKYLIYSAHDTTLAAAMVAMDVWHDVQPYYASGKFLSERQNGHFGDHFQLL